MRRRHYGHLTPLLTRVERTRRRVRLGSRIGFLAETGPHVTITAWITIISLIFSPLLFLSCFLLCLCLCFISPPRRPYAGIFLSYCCFVRAAAISPSWVRTLPFTSLSDLLVPFVLSIIAESFFNCISVLILWSRLCFLSCSRSW